MCTAGGREAGICGQQQRRGPYQDLDSRRWLCRAVLLDGLARLASSSVEWSLAQFGSVQLGLFPQGGVYRIVNGKVYFCKILFPIITSPMFRPVMDDGNQLMSHLSQLLTVNMQIRMYSRVAS